MAGGIRGLAQPEHCLPTLFKFLHAADLHLDSPLRGLDRYEGAPVDAIRQATRRAVENLVSLAIEERVAFVLIAGDLYDGNWKDFKTGQFFVRQMNTLRDAGIDIYFIRGNHDAESVITKSLNLPDNVFGFETAKATTQIHEPSGTAIHGQSFARRSITADLSAGYPDHVTGQFNIGLLHTSAAGYSDHETYAPCTVEGLCSRGYDYWALGHVHARQTLSDNGQIVAFSGNTQGRHMRETGPKGCLLVTVDGGVPQTEFRALDVFRWERVTADAGQCDHPDDVLAAIASELRCVVADAEGRTTAARIEVVGRCEAHGRLAEDTERWEHEARAIAEREVGESVWVEKVRFATAPPANVDDALADGPLADLRQLIAIAESDNALLHELAGELSDLQKKLPREIREFLLSERSAASSIDDPEWFRPFAADAGRLLLARLTEREP